ncbi:MAG: hypothetical protein AAF573_22335 [Bacteroidota bacterium]
MKKLFCHPVCYLIFQLLGIGIDGMLGVGFEMIAVLILSFGKVWSTPRFLQQGVYIILVELIIDILGGDLEMLMEVGVWILEEMKEVLVLGVVGGGLVMSSSLVIAFSSLRGYKMVMEYSSIAIPFVPLSLLFYQRWFSYPYCNLFL